MAEKNEAASAGTETTSKRKTLSKSYQSRLRLSSNSLRDLRTVWGIPPSDIVDEIRKYYPRFDRTMLSKAENGEKWGIVISEEVIRAVYSALGINSVTSIGRIDCHRLTNRVSVRLEDSDFSALNDLRIKIGFGTMQDMLTVIIRDFVKEWS